MKISDHLQEVKFFCMFIGYPRSGHSLVGSLLDAHPDAIISNELNVLNRIQEGKNYSEICELIFENSINYANAGRTNTNFDFSVREQWQGKFKELKIIGDKQGGNTNRQLMNNPSLLHELINSIPVKIKFIHIIRNPFDIISTRYIRQGKTKAEELTNLITDHFEMVANIERIKNQNRIEIIDIRHEDLIRNPIEKLKQLCDYLELEHDDSWIQSCKSILYPTPNESRYKIKWSSVQKKMVYRFIEKYTCQIEYLKCGF